MSNIPSSQVNLHSNMLFMGRVGSKSYIHRDNKLLKFIFPSFLLVGEGIIANNLLLLLVVLSLTSVFCINNLPTKNQFRYKYLLRLRNTNCVVKSRAHSRTKSLMLLVRPPPIYFFFFPKKFPFLSFPFLPFPPTFKTASAGT